MGKGTMDKGSKRAKKQRRQSRLERRQVIRDLKKKLGRRVNLHKGGDLR